MQIIKQVRQIGNISKFSWAEASSDPNGKSTIMPWAGAFLIFIGGVMSVIVTFMKMVNILPQFVFMSSLGAGILVGRKIMNGSPKLEDTSVEDTPINNTDTKCDKPDEVQEG